MDGGRLSAAGPAIRRAVPADAHALARFAAAAFTDTYGATSRPEDVAAYVAAHLAPPHQAAELLDPAMATLLAVASGDGGEDGAGDGAGAGAGGAALVGYAQLRTGGAWPCDVRWHDAAERPSPADAELARLYVARAEHGRGLAARLLAAVRAEARARGAGRLWLCAWEGNARALAFYRKHGFTEAGRATFAMGTEVQHDRLLVAPVLAPAGVAPAEHGA